IFSFESKADPDYMNNYYINNIETINSFCKYLEKSLKNILYAQKKIIVPTIKDIFNMPQNNLNSLLLFNDIPEKTNVSNLTKRELEMIALYVINDATARQSADYLKISKRTVDKHWENIK